MWTEMVVVNKEQESFYLQRNYNRCDEHEKVSRHSLGVMNDEENQE